MSCSPTSTRGDDEAQNDVFKKHLDRLHGADTLKLGTYKQKREKERKQERKRRGAQDTIDPGLWGRGWGSDSTSLSHSLFDQRSGFVVVSTLMGFILFYLGHVLRPGVSFTRLSLHTHTNGEC